MCFFFQQSKTATEAKNRFKADVKPGHQFISNKKFNAFAFPFVSLIANNEPKYIQNFRWGLIPEWSTDEEIRKFTLNARIETLTEKPSFKNSVNKRCIIPANGFFEWHRLDSIGNKKQPYFITFPENNFFAFGGIYSEFNNADLKETIRTFSIVTTKANDLMSEIHNSKKRMPLILSKENEQNWLNNESLSYFYDCNPQLRAEKITKK